MKYFIKNFHVTFDGEVHIKIETNEKMIDIDTKYLDYVVTLMELAKAGCLVTFMDYDISDTGINCMVGDVNIIIGRKYNKLFPEEMTGKEIFLKCLKLLEIPIIKNGSVLDQ